MIETLKKYNDFFMQNNSHGDESYNEIFKFDNRSSRLILSAPHATRSFCNKREKCADLYTGSLVQYLGERHNVSTIVRTKFTPYKALISDYVTEKNLQEHYFLDIHGFNQDIDYDILLGIDEFSEQNYPYLQEIISIAHSYNLKTIVNHENYTGKYGLTGRYQKTYNKPHVIQVELKKYLRDFYSNPEVIKNITVPFFTDVIKLYNQSPL